MPSVSLVALRSFCFSLFPLEAVKLSRIIPLPTAIAIKLQLNTRLQLVDFTRVRQNEIEKKVEGANNFEKQILTSKQFLIR